ncbi:MAG: hypothetical protein JNN28_19615 [Saprospiraceae bacterium]|nr:hypothetical protein [Saprospiraceae bacterium]
MIKHFFSLALIALFCGFCSTQVSAQASGVKPELIMYRHNGGAITPAPAVAGNILGTLKWNGLTAIGDIRTGASIKSVAESVSPGFLLSNMVFSTSGGAGLTERAIITSSGLVGIGTMNPQYHLHIVGNTHTSGRFFGRIHYDFAEPTDLPSTYIDEAYFERKSRAQLGLGANTYNNGGILTMAPGGGSLDRQLFSGGDDGLWTRSQDAGAANAWAAWQKILTSADINGNVGRLPRFTGANLGDPSSTLGNSQLFDDGTHVGIGTTSPDASSLLTVEGNTRINGNTFANGNLGLGLAPTANRLEVLGASRFNGNASVGGNLDVDLSANIDGALQVGGNTTVNANLDVELNANVDGSLQVDGNGRVDGVMIVGNPASTPGNHELYVNGSVIAEEVWVKLQGSWPDYVFEPAYELTPLTEVASFIEENKHLPGVAPAAEMAQNGLSVGEMQKVQMEKIEELFLHVIALEKRIKDLETENAALKTGKK